MAVWYDEWGFAGNGMVYKAGRVYSRGRLVRITVGTVKRGLGLRGFRVSGLEGLEGPTAF